MTRLVVCWLAAVLVGTSALAGWGHAEAGPRSTSVQGAVDGVFAAFQRHPIVGIGDAHHVSQAGIFYAALIRDPRFAQIGNLIVESGGAAHQDIIDRYVNGEPVTSAELHSVLIDVVGWEEPPSQMYTNVFATVRAVNAALPPGKRIHLWLGEPPIDWSRIKTFNDLDPFMAQRDSYPAKLVDEVLDRGGKALVIYGGAHFFFSPMADPIPKLVERDHPGAFFTIWTYIGFQRPECQAAFEARAKAWPRPALAQPIAGTWLETTLERCHGPTGFRSPDPKRVAEANAALSGGRADALLYLGSATGFTLDAHDQDLYLDPSFLDQWNKSRRCCLPESIIDPDRVLRENSSPPRPSPGA